MRKMLILAVLPLTLTACASSRCPNPERCATCPICNPQSSTLTPTSSASPSAAAPAAMPSMATASSVKVYHIAPAKLVQMIQPALAAEPLNLKVISADGGVIQTDWKDYEGEFHIARRWQEHTRYRISVIPDVNDPTSASRFEVAEETQRRSNDRAAWEPAARHPERVEAVIQATDAKLR